MNFTLICYCRKEIGLSLKGAISNRWMLPGFTAERANHRFGLWVVGHILRMRVIAFPIATTGRKPNLDVSKSMCPYYRLQTADLHQKVVLPCVCPRACTAVFR